MSNENEKLAPNQKEKILMMTTELFAQEGYKAVSIRRICNTAGCNLAAISYYFGGKEKLYNECLNRIFSKDISEINKILRPAQDRKTFEQGLFNFCLFFCSFVTKNSPSIRLLISEINAHSIRNADLDKNFLTPIMDSLEAYFKSGIDNEIISPHFEVRLGTKMILSAIVTQNLYRAFKSYEDISSEDFSKLIVMNCTGSFYV